VDKGNDPDTDYDLDLIDGILRPEENVGAIPRSNAQLSQW
jgi:hypothetical protein